MKEMKRILFLVTFSERSIRKFVRQKCESYLMHATVVATVCILSALQNEAVPRCSTIGCTFGFVQTLGFS